MDRHNQHIGGGGGVKVTYIETQFVTSDAAGFKDLVQRLTGRSPTAAAAPVPAAAHRPRASRAGAGRTATAATGARPQGYGCRQAVGEVRWPAVVASRAPPCQEELLFGMDDFSDLFYAGASDQRLHHGLNGGYSDFPY